VTLLKKRLERRFPDAIPSVRRRLVVAMLPSNKLAFREERRRRWFVADLDAIYVQVVRWTVEAERRTRKAERRR